jgi:uncharacterized repeat protein (TIGR03847 family)
MAASFDFDAPDHFTAGAVGPPGQRVFYLQARQSRELVSLKSEKEQVRALGEYLAQLLEKLPPAAGGEDLDTTLIEPVNPAWIVAALGAGYDRDNDRFVLEARELQEEETGEESSDESGDEPAVARFHITRAQAAAFVERVRELMEGGRPICPLCHQPKDPDGHVCPRTNGHVVRPRA